MSLGHQAESKPVTTSDKIMSERHLRHRAEIENMKESGADKADVLKKSIKYNKEHMKEHQKALKDALKRLKKSGKLQ